MLLEKELTEGLFKDFVVMVMDEISKPFTYIRLWNAWRKRSMNSKTHKFLVLIRFRVSPTFELFRSYMKEG